MSRGWRIAWLVVACLNLLFVTARGLWFGEWDGFWPQVTITIAILLYHDAANDRDKLRKAAKDVVGAYRRQA